MRFFKCEIDGLVVIEPDVFNDERGYFIESFRLDQFESEIGKIIFVQENESSSRYGALRGLHYQCPPFAQSKLVRVVSGSVLDIAVDIRKESSTFGKYAAIELSGENKKQLFIPHGFAHGFVTLSEKAVFQYKVDNYYSKESEAGIIWNDKSIGIDWVIPVCDIILSEKDAALPGLTDARGNG